MTGLLAPNSKIDDLELRISRRLDFAQSILSSLPRRLARKDGALALQCLGLLEDLGCAARWRLVGHPLFHRWLILLANSYRLGRLTAIRQLLSELPAFLALPCGWAQMLPTGGLTVAADQGRIRFRGSRCSVTVAESASSAVVENRPNGVLSITADGTSIELSRDELSGKIPSATVHRLPTLHCESIEIDDGDPWVLPLLSELNISKPPRGAPAGDLRPATVTREELSALENAMQTLEEIWPEMALEVARYAGLVVPFSSIYTDAFTSRAWQGAVFFRIALTERSTIVERLVHEASHHRLDAAMERSPLHSESPARRLPSPFHPGPRPVDGLIHGAFVFSRSVQALQRLSGDARAEARAKEIAALVRDALVIIHRDIHLTETGTNLIEEIEAEVNLWKRAC